jgi:hypothetical protein
MKAIQYLTAIDPNLPPALVALVVFVLVYVVRKRWPAAWERFADIVPLRYDSGLVVVALRKLWQAAPSVALGAAAPALLVGGDVAMAVKGALIALAAPALHELAKASPLPYRGAIGAPTKRKDDNDKTPPTGTKLVGLALALLLTSCVPAAPPSPPCDPSTLAGIVAECTTRVEIECASRGVIESECQALKDCDRRLDERSEKCS